MFFKKDGIDLSCKFTRNITKQIIGQHKMLYSGNPGHTQSMIACMILTEYFWKFPVWKIGNVGMILYHIYSMVLLTIPMLTCQIKSIMVLLTGGRFCPYDPADWYCCWRAALHTILLPFRSVLFCSIIHLCCSVSSVKCTKPNTTTQIKQCGKRDNQRHTCQCMSNYHKNTTASRKAHKNSLSRRVKCFGFTTLRKILIVQSRQFSWVTRVKPSTSHSIPRY